MHFSLHLRGNLSQKLTQGIQQGKGGLSLALLEEQESVRCVLQSPCPHSQSARARQYLGCSRHGPVSLETASQVYLAAEGDRGPCKGCIEDAVGEMASASDHILSQAYPMVMDA